ncbi:MAG: hypothetical protein MI861_08020, partial [Pirellulales bacterium]|nr:hypothetical protein [Pirellulales bacterium]
MSFGLLSLLPVLVGIAVIAATLWLAQRLRVQHREVEVLSTIFWRQALEETRARVFVRRFRHWWAWILLVTIASLLWVMLAQPQTHSLDGTSHVVLLDWGVDDAEIRNAHLETAIDVARSLPINDRQIVAVSTKLESLLRPGEPPELARFRNRDAAGQAPRDLNWAIEAIAARAGPQAPLSIHVVGDSAIDQRRLDSLLSSLPSDPASPTMLTINRVQREDLQESAPRLATLGIADASDGSWQSVDLWVAFSDQASATRWQRAVADARVERFRRRKDPVRPSIPGYRPRRHRAASCPDPSDPASVP